MYTPIEERFWKKVKKTDSCWIWIGAKFAIGYGAIFTGKKVNGHKRPVSAHRFSYELKNGPIPNNFFILHKCDNPPCVNPDHLWAGTQRQNLIDCLKKVRMANQYGKFKKRIKT